MPSAKAFTHHDKFLMLALDQLGSFRALINADKGDNENADKMRMIGMKKKILRPLVSKFSGVLLESEFGLPAYRQAVREQTIDNPKPFLLRIEETGYDTVGGERVTPLRFSAAELKKQGASGVKLLLYLNPLVSTFKKQVGVAWEVQEQARNQQMPYFLEVLLYDTPANPAPTEKFLAPTLRELIDRGVRPDVWKLPFPGLDRLCQRITQIAADTPWVLLSHGTPFNKFKNDLRICIENGASGFLAGRALWQEVGRYQGQKQERFLFSTLPKRFNELAQVVKNID